VTPIDLVAASGWVIEGNFIADFVKAGGDQTSYGAFAKGGGSANRFTRNVVLCEHRLRGQAGRRVGLSFGGGGTNPQACRDRRCIVEQERGFMTSNLVASCSDSGMYINRSAQTEISNNTLLDTGGITVQSPASSARVDGNLMDGPIIDRHDAILDLGDNLAPSLPMLYLGIASARSAFVSPADLDLRWSTAPPRRPDSTESQTGEADPDLCGQTRHHPPVYGAFQDFQVCMSPR
jgi:parallel beta-helix repeat protein